VIAYKFLRAGRIGPFSEFHWPTPGSWVRVDAETQPCRHGIHACRVSDLPWWLADELWEIELDGSVRADAHKILAPAGRLLSRVDAWTPASAQEYADACAWRTRDTAVRALLQAHHEQAADRLAGCATLDELLATARELARDVADTRISLTIAGDGAFRALTGAPPTAAYIAAHAALRLDGPPGYAVERERQSRWLVQRLGLRFGT
jgi:hypothetical protein